MQICNKVESILLDFDVKQCFVITVLIRTEQVSGLPTLSNQTVPPSVGHKLSCGLMQWRLVC